MGRWLNWIHAPWALALWAMVVIHALYLVASCWDRFAASSEGILAPANWFGIALSCLGLKFLHEVSHGLACKRHGGTVREAGVMLLLFAPIPYIDATSSWRFPSKWQRIQTAAAGVYVELLLAAVAMIIWHATEPCVVNHICYNVAIVGGLLTLVTNANPLMRFDGYYIFADLVEIPNLYSSGQESLKRWGCCHLLGVETTVSQWSRSRGKIIGRNLESLLGTYLEEGAEILAIGEETQKELKVSIAQNDIDVFKTYVQQPIHFSLKSSERFTSRLDKVDPRAQSELPHPALSGAMGGPLPVRAEPSRSLESNASERYVLLASRFLGSVELDSETSASLHAGQVATVTIRPFHVSIGAHLVQTVARWIRARVREQAN